MRAWLVGVLMVVAACGGAAADETISTSPAAVTTAASESVTPPPLVSSTTAPGPIDTCGSGAPWMENVTYTADCFVVPVSFRPEESEWRSLSAGDEWIELLRGDVTPGALSAHVLVIAYRLRDAPADVIDSVVEIDGVDPVGPVASVRRGGHDALTVDVTTGRYTDNPNAECSTGMLMGLRYSIVGGAFNPAFLLADVGRAGATRGYGLGACKTFRLWVIGVDDLSITVIATAAGAADDRFDEIVPAVERLLDSMSFEAP